ncbi:MAG TPA: serine protease [Vicinamibacteria bacterium]|nr:serine protease [Vicinamibacteria bacterium]
MIASLVVASLAAAPLAPDPRAARTMAEVEEAQAQLVTVRRPEGDMVARGSAFYVDAYGHLVTCAHVLDHMPKDEVPRLRLRDGRERRFSVVTVDRETDLALLLSDPPSHFLALAEATMPSIGQAVLLGGFAARPLDLDTALRLTPGTVVSRERRWATGVRRTVGSRRRIITVKIDPTADAGQSGGPVLAEGTFEAIGVLRANLESATGGLAGTPRLGYSAAIPLLYVKPLLEPKD